LGQSGDVDDLGASYCPFHAVKYCADRSGNMSCCSDRSIVSHRSFPATQCVGISPAS